MRIHSITSMQQIKLMASPTERMFFSKWNKDKLSTLYNHSKVKVRLYPKGHCKASTTS